MRPRLLVTAASLLFLTSIPAALADWGDHHDYIRHLRWVCHQGNRHACFRLGQEVQERRDARRERWEWRQRDAWRGCERWAQQQPRVWVQPMWGGWARGW
jgi:hypothetical protein